MAGIAGTDLAWRFGGGIIKRVRGEVGRSAKTDAELGEAIRSIAKLAEEMKTINEQYRDHEIECAEFRGQTVQALKGIETSMGKVERNQEQLQSQVRLAVTGAANKIMELPPDT